MKTQYFSEYAGKVYAILNSWRRKSQKDVMIAMPLDTRELRIYRQLKNNGKSDSTVFKALFSREIPLSSDDKSLLLAKRKSGAESLPLANRKVEIDINDLNKKQLIYLILREMQTTLQSLPRMTTADLRKILLAIKQRKNSRSA